MPAADGEGLSAIQMYVPLIQSGALLVTLLIGISTIIVNMRIARRRATLDIMMVEQTNPDWIQMRREFVRLKERGHLSQWAAPDKATSEEFTVIKSYLNRYEIISIGVRRGTLSERIYKEWWRTAFVEDWIAVKPLVLEIRNRHSPKFFIEYEWLAKRWASIDERERV